MLDLTNIYVIAEPKRDAKPKPKRYNNLHIFQIWVQIHAKLSLSLSAYIATMGSRNKPNMADDSFL